MAGYNPHETEAHVKSIWKQNSTYAKAKRKGKQNWYFLDGPPYTSGHVHIGTAWNKALKDCMLRYKRMKGFKVWDRAGYDMHGLPTARKVQAKLKLEHKEDILKFGIGKFVKECQSFAIKNMKAMNKEFSELGVWMDFENAYMPISKDYIEGEWWLIKQAEKKNRLYEAKKTMHWCKSCSTALAKHELEYHTLKETSIFVKFRLKGKQNEYIVIWTTTPWTIPFNMGVMVHPDLDYVRLKTGNEIWIVSKGLCQAFMNAVVQQPFEIIEEFKGKQLEGLAYEHPQAKEIAYFKSVKKAHIIVLSKEYVDLSAGTGLVHMAPGCGPEDYEVGHREGIAPFNNLNEAGEFPKEMGKFAGWVAKKDDAKFIKDLEERGALVATSPVEHEYAHCWRCKEPVIFRTTSQWFFKVEDLIPEMRELNKGVKWEPDWAGKNWFDSWLEKLRDNSITRQRFWGTPLPIWKCDRCGKHEVIGSIKTLKAKAGRVPEDLHKPWIDELKWKCSCGGTMVRSPDILDVWIDAGTASWNCLNFPQKTKDFKELYPPDFILEGKDQIRGWFNLLLVSSMVAMRKPAFKSCYMHGFVQDPSGRKMSKSLGNIITPKEVLEEFGADTFRLYAIGAANAGLDLNYNKDDVRTKFRNLGILWNVQNYLLSYAKNPKLNSNPQALEERYILSKLNSTIIKVSEAFETMKLDKVPGKVEELFLELSRNYIQFTRDKMLAQASRTEVVNTIFTVLLETLKLLAPIAPFISEEIYLNLKAAFKLKEDSVHLLDWPKPNKKLIDEKLEAQVELASACIQGLLNCREKAKLGIRWPIGEAVISPELKGVETLIKKQTNIKKLSTSLQFELRYEIKPNFKTMGKAFGQEIPKVVELISKTKNLAEKLKTGKTKLGKYVLLKEHVNISEILPPDWVAADSRAGRVYLHTKLTPELEAEGYSRELMRRIQSLRKKAGLVKEDEIELAISSPVKLDKFSKEIAGKCGASSLSFEYKPMEHSEEHKINGRLFRITLRKR